MGERRSGEMCEDGWWAEVEPEEVDQRMFGMQGCKQLCKAAMQSGYASGHAKRPCKRGAPGHGIMTSVSRTAVPNTD